MQTPQAAEPAYSSLWQKYRDDNVVNKARDYSRYTLAKLVSDADAADANDVSRQQLTHDYQSVGALLVNNLVSRLGEYLFPATARFVRIKPKELTDEMRQKMGEVNRALILIEKTIVEKSKSNGGYADILQALAYEVVTGNVAIYRDSETGTYRTYGLENFVVQRDGRGCVSDAIVKERIQFDALPSDFQAQLKAKNFSADSTRRIWLYTRIKRVQRGKAWGYEIRQQIGSMTGCIYTPGADYYPEKVSPWFFPVWSLKSGEHYGRGLVEDHAGDFARLSMLSESSALYMQEAMRVFWVLNGGGGSADDVNNAETGEVITFSGTATELKAMEAGSFQKVQMIRDEINQLVQRLSQAFMFTGEFRDSERTTATEIQQVAQSAERTMGGPYSMQAKTFQIPLAYILLAEIDSNQIDSIVGNKLELQVVAGLDALGRSIEASQLIQALSDSQAAIAAVANINQIAGNTLDPDVILETIFSSNGVSLSDYRRSVQDLQAQGQAIDQAVNQANGVQAPIAPASSINTI